MKRTAFTVWCVFSFFRQNSRKAAKPKTAPYGVGIEYGGDYGNPRRNQVLYRPFWHDHDRGCGHDDYEWSRSVPNLSGKLRRGTLRYGEAVELADVLDYDIV